MIPETRFAPLDLTSWERGQMFYYFSRMAPTGYSLTAELDVTRLRQSLRAKELKFFPAYLWLVTRTLAEQPTAFQLAELDGQLGSYNILTPLYAAFHEDSKTFSLLWTTFDSEFPAFHAAYLENQRRYGDGRGALARSDTPPPANAYTVSCLPWVSFRHFAVHSYESKPYYFPSVEAGKWEERDGKTLLPLSLTCHHAATDGWHIAQFLDSLQQAMNTPEQWL